MSERKKRKSNPFFLFREKVKKEAGNVKMTEVSNIASEKWKQMSEEEKAYWKRLYEINRDTIDTETITNQNLPASDVIEEFDVRCSENRENYLDVNYPSSVLKDDCYLTESLEVNDMMDIKDIDNYDVHSDYSDVCYFCGLDCLCVTLDF